MTETCAPLHPCSQCGVEPICVDDDAPGWLCVGCWERHPWAGE